MTLSRPIYQDCSVRLTHPGNPGKGTHDGGRWARTLTDTDHGMRSSHHPVQNDIAESARLYKHRAGGLSIRISPSYVFSWLRYDGAWGQAIGFVNSLAG